MTNDELNSSPGSGRNPGRPLSVSILIIMVLIFTTMNIVQAVTAVRSLGFLPNLLPGVPIYYLIITGVLWSLVGIPIAFGLFTRKKWSRTWTPVIIILYTIYYWVDKLIIAHPAAIVGRLPFVLILNVLFVLLGIWVLVRQKSKEYLVK